MSSDLVKRLREYCSIDKGADPIMLKVLSVVRPDIWEAADRIEALEAEVAALEAAADTTREKWAALVQKEQARAERLRVALQNIKAIGFGAATYKLGRNIGKAVEIARKALEASDE